MKGRCCFKCKHRLVVPFDKCPRHIKRDGGGFDKWVIEWDKLPVCKLDPTVMHTMGDITMVCDRFELDRTRWHSLCEQEWEFRFRVRNARNGQTTLEGYL